jgi:hypothetical protein
MRMQPMGLRILRRWTPHGSEGGPPSNDVRLGGGECGIDPALGVVHLVMSASGVEIGSPDGSGDSWWSVRPSNGGAATGGSRDKGHRQVCSTRNLWHTEHRSDDLGRWTGGDGGLALLSIDDEWAWSTIGGRI